MRRVRNQYGRCIPGTYIRLSSGISKAPCKYAPRIKEHIQGMENNSQTTPKFLHRVNQRIHRAPQRNTNYLRATLCLLSDPLCYLYFICVYLWPPRLCKSVKPACRFTCRRHGRQVCESQTICVRRVRCG